MQGNASNTVKSVKLLKSLVDPFPQETYNSLGSAHISLKMLCPLEIQNLSEEMPENIYAFLKWCLPDLVVTSLDYFW